MDAAEFMRHPHPILFRYLRSGRDAYSSLRLHRLLGELPPATVIQLQSLTDPSQIACAARWVLRGLSPEWAIGLVKYQEQVAEAIASKVREAKEIKDCLGYDPLDPLRRII